MPSIDSKNESPFVSFAKLLESIEVIKKLSQKSLEKSGKKQLLEDQNEDIIILQINFKKIPFNKTTFIHSISLPNHWRHESDFETCLIVKDLNKKPLTDRELDIDLTKSHYKELLENKESIQLIDEILPMRELRNEYTVYEAKQKLCNAFNLFLCDKKLLHNKFDYLSRFLGKTFWIDGKKVPIPLDLTDINLKSQLESKLNQTYIYLSGKGSSSIVKIGLIKQSTQRLAENLLDVNKKIYELFKDNVRSLILKTEKSMAITFFLDCGFGSDIKLEKPMNDNKPIEDEFSHFINSKIQVFKSGDVKVVPNEDNSSDEISDTEKQWRLSDKKSVKRKRKNFKRKTNALKKFKIETKIKKKLK